MIPDQINNNFSSGIRKSIVGIPCTWDPFPHNVHALSLYHRQGQMTRSSYNALWPLPVVRWHFDLILRSKHTKPYTYLRLAPDVVQGVVKSLTWELPIPKSFLYISETLNMLFLGFCMLVANNSMIQIYSRILTCIQDTCTPLLKKFLTEVFKQQSR